MNSKELFLEIGTEEIPAGFLPKAMADMEGLIRKELENARLTFGTIKTLATPRRLVLHVTAIPALQPDAETTALGPARSIAFGPDGKPGKAAEGFARGQGIDVSQLTVAVTDKGEYLAAVKKRNRQTGASAAGGNPPPPYRQYPVQEVDALGRL